MSRQFASSARQVFLMANRNAVSVFISFGTMASMYPSTAEKSNGTLPFVTIDGFDAIARGFRNASKSTYIHYKPLLHTLEDVQKWNNYTANHMEWLISGRKRETYAENETVSDKFVPFVYKAINSSVIFPVSGNGPFAPAWQISPIPAKLNIINYDSMTLPTSRASMEYVLQTGKPSLTEPLDGIRNYFTFPVEGPISPLYHPVFDKPDDQENRTVIGFLSGYLPWKYFFDNVLPDGQEDTLLVVQSCSTSSTFLIKGPEALFVGNGDLHDPRYSHMRKTASFIQADDDEALNPMAKVQCHHIVHVFPTAAMEEAYKTSTPMSYAIIIVAIFSFSAIMFLLYDFFVTSRQNRTERQADKSHAIVQDMFPGDMASRLFEAGDGGSEEFNTSVGGVGRMNRLAEFHPEATVLCKCTLSVELSSLLGK
jgi:CHASE domain